MLALLILPGLAAGQETVVQNDTLMDFQQAAICPCFAVGEQAAAWLTSPCDGDMVAIQILWRSFLGGAGSSLEAALWVYDGSTFPSPGATLFGPLLGPVLVDGDNLNEFRYTDEMQTVPISVPVTSGQTFVVALEFAIANALTLGPSVVHDNDGCKANRNGVFAVPGGWTDACTIGGGIGGNWVIRAIVDCAVDPTLIFTDGFESGSTSAWSTEEPLP